MGPLPRATYTYKHPKGYLSPPRSGLTGRDFKTELYRRFAETLNAASANSATANGRLMTTRLTGWWRAAGRNMQAFSPASKGPAHQALPTALLVTCPNRPR